MNRPAAASIACTIFLLSFSGQCEDEFSLRHDCKAARWDALKAGKPCVLLLNIDAVMVNMKLRDIEPVIGRSKAFRKLSEKVIAIGVRSGEECDALRRELKTPDDVIIFDEDGQLHALLSATPSLENADPELLSKLGSDLVARINHCLPLAGLQETEQAWREKLDDAGAWEALRKKYVEFGLFERLDALFKAATLVKPPTPAVKILHRISSYLIRCKDVDNRSGVDLLAEAEKLLIEYPEHTLAKDVADTLVELDVPLFDTVARLRAYSRHGAAAKQAKFASLADQIERFSRGGGGRDIERLDRVAREVNPRMTVGLKAAIFDAEAAEKAGELGKAVTAYEEALNRANGDAKESIETALKRLKADPKLHEPEARRRLNLAANFLLNNATEPARKTLEEVVKKYPGTEAAKDAAKKLATLPSPAIEKTK